jgi:hypothetical protein
LLKNEEDLVDERGTHAEPKGAEVTGTQPCICTGEGFASRSACRFYRGMVGPYVSCELQGLIMPQHRCSGPKLTIRRWNNEKMPAAYAA